MFVGSAPLPAGSVVGVGGPSAPGGAGTNKLGGSATSRVKMIESSVAHGGA